MQKREKNDRLKRIANRPKRGKRDMKRKAKARALILAAVLGSAVLLGGCARQTGAADPVAITVWHYYTARSRWSSAAW